MTRQRLPLQIFVIPNIAKNGSHLLHTVPQPGKDHKLSLGSDLLLWELKHRSK